MAKISRFYTVSFSAVGVTAVQDLFELKAGASVSRLILHGFEVFQSSDTDAEVLRVTVKRRTSGYTSGSGGSTATPRPGYNAETAATFTAEINNTTQASDGTGAVVTLVETGWYNLNPCIWTPPSDQFVVDCGTSQALLISLETAPADSLTMSGTAYVEEIIG